MGKKKGREDEKMPALEMPHLPCVPVRSVLISSAAGKDVFVSLQRMGVEAVLVGACRWFSPPVACHADMQFFHLGGCSILHVRGASRQACGNLLKLGFRLREAADAPTFTSAGGYPREIALNAARVGDFLFCRQALASPTLLAWCQRKSIHIDSVRQGYAKCAVCVADSRSLITADTGIADAAEKSGFAVLRIRAGFVNLAGYDTGFFGGCCGKLAPDILACCGDPTTHPDYPRMAAFLEARHIHLLPLCGGPLTDIGGILPLTETGEALEECEERAERSLNSF